MDLYKKILVQHKIPPFSSDQWKTFENFCCDIFRVVWNDLYAQLNGRIYQPQNGVDIFGYDRRTDREKPHFIGVQCKRRSDSKDLLREIKEDAKKAEAFKPKIQEFILCTTIARDEKIQKAINMLNIERESTGMFPIYIKFWDDLLQELNKGIAQKYFPEYSGFFDFNFPFTEFNDLIDSRKNLHPNKHDFENDLYYKNEELHDEIDTKFTDGNRCILLGKPARGKTSLALGFAYMYLKEENQDKRKREVFYLDVQSNKEVQQWKQQMELFNYSHCLFIIDNCHQAVDEVNDLVNWWDRIKKAKILLVSRDINKDYAGLSVENYMKLMYEEERVVKIETDDVVFEGVISNYRKFFNKDSNEVGDVKDIFEKCGGNLYLLYLFIKEWKKREKESMSQVESQDVLDDVHYNYLKDVETSEAFKKIAALYQFEIPVQKNYLKASFENKEGWLDEFIEGSERRISFFTYHHSTIAWYVLKAAHKKGKMDGLTQQEYTFNILMEYIRFKPVNFFGIFKALYQNNKIDLQSRIFKEEATFKAFEDIINNYSDKRLIESLNLLSNFLSALWSNDDEKIKIKAYDYTCYLKKKLDKESTTKLLDLYDIHSLIALLKVAKINKCFNDYLIKLDYKKLGMAARDEDLGIIAYFRTLSKGVHEEKIKDFITALDCKALGEQSKEVGLSAVRNFIQIIGLENDYIRDFCDGLSFKKLGERSKEVGLATVRNFIQLIYQSGLDKQYIRDFCDGLDFKKLGKRSKKVGLTTVVNFIKIIYFSGIERQYIRDFCDGLSFKKLGERSKEVGLATILIFIQNIYHSRVKREYIEDFCCGMGFYNLGEKFKPLVLESKKNLLDLNLMLNFFIQGTAVEFINGIGWDTIKKAIESHFSPDELMILDILFFERCEFTRSDLAAHQIFLRNATILFHSFTQHERSHYNHSGQQKIQNYYMTYALDMLKKDKDLDNKISLIDDLEEWENFIFNLRVAAPYFIEEKFSPILQKYRTDTFNYMFSRADLKTTVHFLNHFNPIEPIFTWKLPADIQFLTMDFSPKIQKSSLVDIAHFVFNFYFINRPDCSQHFSKEVDKQDELLLSKADDKEISLRNIEFFLWNLWLALPENKVPSILNNSQFVDIIFEKSKKRNKKKEDLLSIIGIYFLTAQEVPVALCERINTKAIGDIFKLIKDLAYKGMRILAGYRYLTGEKIKREDFNKHFDYVYENTLDIPNQKIMLHRFLLDVVENNNNGESRIK